MSKRQRKSKPSRREKQRRIDKPNARQQGVPEHPSHGAGEQAESANSTSSDLASAPVQSRYQQLPLLMLALCLLTVVGWINWQRWQRAALPAAVPMPAEALLASAHDSVEPNPATPNIAEGVPARLFSVLDPTQTGIAFSHPVQPDHPRAYLYFSSQAAGGTAIGDVNNDGRPDVFVASGPLANRLYLQTERPLKFRDATDGAGLDQGDVWSCGATMVDINGDGWLDIFVANYDAPCAMFLNLGNGRFRNVAADYGLNITDATLEGVFADYDCDGDLDMYLLTYRFVNPQGMPQSPPVVSQDDKRQIRQDMAKYYEITQDTIGYGVVGRTDGLLRNNGDGTFTNVTSEAGIYGAGHGQSATWWDYDQDGFPDLHVGNDFNDPDRLYHNNGDGTFSDIIRDAVPHTTWFSMGSASGDVDGDGRPDLLTTDMSSTTHFKQKTTMGSMGSNREFLMKAMPRQYMRNALLLNSGTPRFREAAYLTGLDSTDWTWSVKLLDADNDGRLDALFTNGSVRSFTDSDRVLTLQQRKGKTEWDIYRDTAPMRERNLAFRNRGQLRFDDASRDWGWDHEGVSMSAASGDLDGDGDLDMIVANLDEPIAVYRNDSPPGSSITLRLHGRGQNRYGIGAEVRLRNAAASSPDDDDAEASDTGKAAELQIRQLYPSRGFLASDQPIVHFGCGAASVVDLEVRWPSGATQEFPGLAVGKHYQITEPMLADQPDQAVGETALSDEGSTNASTPMFRCESLAGVAHDENEFDDYAVQSLLPHRMSRLGPGLAAGDLDGDGQAEIVFGGARGQAAQLLRHDGKRFETSQPAALAEHRQHEDLGLLWADLDGDGDDDLLVASGGNESSDGAYPLRFYRNLDGRLVSPPNDDDAPMLPAISTSGGPLAAADFDGDGDLDVFVGGRQVPGQYPLPGKSFLLVNEGGRLVDASLQHAAALKSLGMVTGALWTDVDQDQDLDLMVTTEWGAIRVLRNEQGKLTDATADSGLAAFLGWWTGLAAGDIDQDGDLDYVATNLGLNSKYHANDAHPFRLYFGDFAGNGRQNLVEAEYENDTLFPMRGKSCSTHAMPMLAEKFKTYQGFAAASLSEIYTPQRLQDAYQVSANWLSTSLLINDGQGRFEVRPLPADAQIAPCFGAHMADMTGNGNVDIVLAQNFFSPQPETGNMDGGLGCLLEGQGNGEFRSVPASRSGIVVPEDAKALVVGEWNDDGAPDVLIATNDGPVKQLLSQPSAPGKARCTLRISPGSAGSLVGMSLQLWRANALIYTQELSAGSGYLSQQPMVVHVPGGIQDQQILQLRWRTPGGRSGQQNVRVQTGKTIKVLLHE